MLKVTRCPSVHIVWEKLNQADLRRALNRSSHLFLIAIETQSKIEKLSSRSVDTKRPINVQITSSVSNKPFICYKEENSKQINEVKFQSPTDIDTIQEKIRSKTFCNFASLTQALSSSILGSFNGSLLDVKLINDKNRREIVNSVDSTNALCHLWSNSILCR